MLVLAGGPAVVSAHGRRDAAVDQAAAAAPSAGVGAPGADYDPFRDPYSMESVTTDLGARRWWLDGLTGAGVDVAIIDTGIAPVAGLDRPGKVINGPDLSFESQDPNLTQLDTNGHGTFMAGVIAGDDTGPARRGRWPASGYRGVAPDARIVSVKVATADGAVDVTQVIAAIDWVVQHRNDNGLNIRVLNLAYTVAPNQPWQVDPLSYAAEQAWKHGIVVVAAAGNASGDQVASGVASPAYNPHLIAVGSFDSGGTPARADDDVADYSATSEACANECRGPDLLGMGSHLQGLRVPGSYIDLAHPEARLGDRYFRGSGTSQAAATVSGAAALVLQKYPFLTPDQVKAILKSSAMPIPGVPASAQGAGMLDLHRARFEWPRWSVQQLPAAIGGGSLELARGDAHLTLDGVELTGEVDIFGLPLDTTLLASLEAEAATWNAGVWNGSSWSGSSWSGSSWSGSSWSGSSWSGSSWSGSSWSGSSWSGSSWSGSAWSGSAWAAHSWT